MAKQRSYPPALKIKARQLRTQGKTYRQINHLLETAIPKSTLTTWCRHIALPPAYSQVIRTLSRLNLMKARKKALTANRKKRLHFLESLDSFNQKIAKKIRDKSVAKIALAFLCLGEASKYSKSNRAFTLGSSDKRIVRLFLKLLQYCFDDFDISKVRCTVQCRADQDVDNLNRYWRKATGIPSSQFYKPRVDPRTTGKKTKKQGYKGVLRINYLHSKTQLDLESLANLIYKRVAKGPVV